MSRTFTIIPAKIPAWRYEIIAKGYHNIAPSIDAAITLLKDRFGQNVKIRIVGQRGEEK